MGSAALRRRAGCSTPRSVGLDLPHRNGHRQHASVIDGFGSAAQPCWMLYSSISRARRAAPQRPQAACTSPTGRSKSVRSGRPQGGRLLAHIGRWAQGTTKLCIQRLELHQGLKLSVSAGQTSRRWPGLRRGGEPAARWRCMGGCCTPLASPACAAFWDTITLDGVGWRQGCRSAAVAQPGRQRLVPHAHCRSGAEKARGHSRLASSPCGCSSLMLPPLQNLFGQPRDPDRECRL